MRYNLKAPPGFEPLPGVLEALREIFEVAGVPSQAGQNVLNQVVGWFDQKEREAEASAARELEAEMQQAWGADAGRKLYVAQHAARTLALDPSSAAALAAALGSGGFPLVEMFYRIGETLEAAPTHAEANSASTKRADQMDTNPSDSKSIEWELNRLHSEHAAILNDPRHLRYEEVMTRRQQLISKLARARAAEGGSEPEKDARKQMDARKQIELDLLHRDPEFLKVTSDVRHPRYQEFLQRRQRIIDGMMPAARTADPDRFSRNKGELDRLQSDPQFLKVMADARHPQHRELVERRQTLIGEMAKDWNGGGVTDHEQTST